MMRFVTLCCLTLVSAVHAQSDITQRLNLNPKTSGGRYLNVCTETPVGTFREGSDITKALQWAIDHQHQGDGFEPYLPRGVWYWSETLYIPNRIGGKLRGMGAGPNTMSGGGNRTLLCYRGPNDRPAIQYQGNNWRIADITFAGRIKNDGRERSNLGILATTIKDRDDAHYQQTGTTALRLENVWLVGWETCIQNGGHVKTINSDMHSLERVTFYDCGTGFHNVHHMGMGLDVHKTTLMPSVEVGFRFDAGGTAMFTDCGMGGHRSATKFLVIGKYVSHTNGGFTIEGMKVDGSIDGTTEAEVVHMVARAPADIVLSNLRNSNPAYARNGGKTATLVGDASLTIRDSYNVGQITCEAWEWKGVKFRPAVLLDNLRMPSSVDPNHLATGDCLLRVRDCLSWNGLTTTGPNPRPAVWAETPAGDTTIEEE